MGRADDSNVEAAEVGGGGLHLGDSTVFLQRSRGLAVLLEASRRLASTLELQPVLQATVDGVAELAGLDTAAVYLTDDEQLVLWATAPPLPPGFPDELRRFFAAEHPHLARTVIDARPLLVADIRKESLTRAEQTVVEQRNLRTLLYLPLVADQEVVGALIVGSTGEPVQLLDADVDLCNTLANLAALAVRNAQLYTERRQYAARLEQILEERKAAEAERAALQQQLAQAQKLETIGQLAGGVAHDFNNMLSAILVNVDSALAEVEPHGRLHVDLEEIQSAAQRSARLTSQLLAFARLQPAVPRAVDLNDTVAGLLTMLRRVISEGIEIEWSPHASLWPVRVDPSQVDQVLVNLCVNARDALFGSGRIVIATGNLPEADAGADTSLGEQPDFQPGDYVTISVTDDGCGMDEATRARIFDPFFTTKGLGRGTGLGLATVYGIVKQNGGIIRVRSELGKGSSFEILLPRCDAPVVEAATKTQPSRPRRGQECVLVVEDEPMLLSLSRRILENEGYRVLTAATPRQALPLAAEHRDAIQLLMSDVNMPGMGGPQLAAILRAQMPDLKVLLVSGYAAEGLDGAPLEGVHFLPKPYNTETLITKVREVMDD